MSGSRLFVGVAEAANIGNSPLIPSEAAGAFVQFAVSATDLGTATSALAESLSSQGLSFAGFDSVGSWDGHAEAFEPLVRQISDSVLVVIGDTFSYESEDE